MDVDLSLYHQYLKITEDQNQRVIYDPVRKRNLVLQPEELVRQTWIQYLIKEHQFSLQSLAVEKSLKIADQQRRYDLVYHIKAKPVMLFEFKSFKEKLTEDVCQQIAHYNLKLKVPYLVISNGMETYLFHVDYANNVVDQIQDFPAF